MADHGGAAVNLKLLFQESGDFIGKLRLYIACVGFDNAVSVVLIESHFHFSFVELDRDLNLVAVMLKRLRF